MPPPREWRGSVIAVRGRLYLQVKDESGRWVQRAPFADRALADTPENRAAAERRLAEIRSAMHARERGTGGEPGPLTVRRWSETWLATRDNADATNDEARLRLHVWPEIGDLRLDEVEPRHVAALVRGWKDKAARTRRNIYSVLKALFRDARIEGVLRGPDPCILTHRQLGRIKDGPAFDRATAVFSREELVTLVSDPRVPHDRRVWYALLGLGMLRTGEAAGLRWGKVQRGEPLGRLVIDTSYDNARTKTDEARWMPIHPALAAVLAEWRLSGWARTFGRTPEPGDLVCPIPRDPHQRGRKHDHGAMRDKSYSRKRLVHDLAVLELRPRRAHDLRRTGISLARSDGADRDRLKWGTHAPPRSVMDLYTSPEWAAVCAEVARIRISIVLTSAGEARPDEAGEPRK
jgi:hypothetical protein